MMTTRTRRTSRTSLILRTASSIKRKPPLAHGFAEPSDEEEEEEYVGDEDEAKPEPLRKGEKNSHLTIGYKGDAFVVRGDKIGVFRQRDDGSVQYQASIGNVQTPKGKKFKPNKVRWYRIPTQYAQKMLIR